MHERLRKFSLAEFRITYHVVNCQTRLEVSSPQNSTPETTLRKTYDKRRYFQQHGYRYNKVRQSF